MERRDRMIFPSVVFTLQTVTMNSTEPIRTQEPRAASASPTWVQGPKDLSHLPLLFHATSRRWSSRETNWHPYGMAGLECGRLLSWATCKPLGSLFSMTTTVRALNSIHISYVHIRNSNTWAITTASQEPEVNGIQLLLYRTGASEQLGQMPSPPSISFYN